MQRTIARLNKQEPTTIVVIGDSCSVDTPWTYGRKNWVQYLAEALWHTYGDGFITLLNSSRCGAAYATELPRLEASVLRFKPDLVVSAIGKLNTDDGPEALATDRNAARQVVARIQAASGEILFVTINPVVWGFWEPRPEGAPSGEAFLNHHGRSEASARALVKFAAELGLPVVDVYAAWKKHTIPFKSQTSHPQGLRMRMAPDTVHPGPTGHLAIFRQIAPYFEVPPYFAWEEVPFEYPAKGASARKRGRRPRRA